MSEQKNDYTLESLISIFNKHACEFEEQIKHKISDHEKDDFNLPRALAIICYELEKLKNRCV